MCFLPWNGEISILVLTLKTSQSNDSDKMSCGVPVATICPFCITISESQNIEAWLRSWIATMLVTGNSLINCISCI